MTGLSFDLRDRPWLPVRHPDGATEEVSLREVFRRAPDLTGIGGELPTTSVALLRFLVAILAAAVGSPERPMAQWRELWRAPELPFDLIEEYLGSVGDRFDLWHPSTPFLQVAELQAVNGKVGGLLPLIADVPNNDQFFTTRARRGVRSVDFAEAARWLLHCQAYDPSGIKSGAVGDGRVKGGKGYPIGTGWAGSLGIIVLEGRSLKETLLLNLPLASRNGDPLPADDPPVWQRAALTGAEERQGGAPTGPIDLLSWPSRRIRLVPDGDQVVGALICNGDRIGPQNQLLEPMTAWRRSPTQEKALGQPLVYMPLTHQPERALWRGLHALLPLTSPHAGDGADRMEPATLRWLRTLLAEDDGTLDPDMPLRTRAVGIVYGSNNSVVQELVDDALTVHAVLIGDHGQPLRKAAIDAAAAADLAAAACSRLAGHLALAVGGDATPARDAGRERYYVAVDAAYRAWLASLRPGTDPVTAQQQWQREATRQAYRYEAELQESASPAAWVGRAVTDRQGRAQWYDAAQASRWFRTALRSALPLAHPPEPAAEAPDPPLVEEEP